MCLRSYSFICPCVVASLLSHASAWLPEVQSKIAATAIRPDGSVEIESESEHRLHRGSNLLGGNALVRSQRVANRSDEDHEHQQASLIVEGHTALGSTGSKPGQDPESPPISVDEDADDNSAHEQEELPLTHHEPHHEDAGAPLEPALPPESGGTTGKGGSCTTPDVEQFEHEEGYCKTGAVMQKGQMCMLKCKPGFLPSSEILKCMGEEGVLPADVQCVKACNVQYEKDGQMLSKCSGTDKLLLKPAEKCYKSCFDGKAGIQWLTCDDTGELMESENCEHHCLEPTGPGVRGCEEGFKEMWDDGSTCSLHCSSGDTPIPLLCRSGEWTKTNPEAEGDKFYQEEREEEESKEGAQREAEVLSAEQDMEDPEAKAVEEAVGAEEPKPAVLLQQLQRQPEVSFCGAPTKEADNEEAEPEEGEAEAAGEEEDEGETDASQTDAAEEQGAEAEGGKAEGGGEGE